MGGVDNTGSVAVVAIEGIGGAVDVACTAGDGVDAEGAGDVNEAGVVVAVADVGVAVSGVVGIDVAIEVAVSGCASAIIAETWEGVDAKVGTAGGGGAGGGDNGSGDERGGGSGAAAQIVHKFTVAVDAEVAALVWVAVTVAVAADAVAVAACWVAFDVVVRVVVVVSGGLCLL